MGSRPETAGIQPKAKLLAGVGHCELRILLALGILLAPAALARAQVTFLGLNTNARLSENHRVVILTGSLTCRSSEAFVVSVVVQQEDSASTVAGSGNTGPRACTGRHQSFALSAMAEGPVNLSYRNGPVTIMVAADVLSNKPAPGRGWRKSSELLSAKLNLSDGTLRSATTNGQEPAGFRIPLQLTLLRYPPRQRTGRALSQPATVRQRVFVGDVAFSCSRSRMTCRHRRCCLRTVSLSDSR